MLSGVPLVQIPVDQDVTNASGQVASHTSGRPDCQGTKVVPSGLLPLDRRRPGGSNLEGTPAANYFPVHRDKKNHPNI